MAPLGQPRRPEKATTEERLAKIRKVSSKALTERVHAVKQEHATVLPKAEQSLMTSLVSQQVAASLRIIVYLPLTLRKLLRARLMQTTDAVMSTATMRCVLLLQSCPTVEIMRWLSTSLVGKARKYEHEMIVTYSVISRF